MCEDELAFLVSRPETPRSWATPGLAQLIEAEAIPPLGRLLDSPGDPPAT